ncbi:TPA: hypothetical protein ACXND4_003481, partial [Burkholderia multivorans]
PVRPTPATAHSKGGRDTQAAGASSRSSLRRFISSTTIIVRRFDCAIGDCMYLVNSEFAI